jgi:DNA helicase IV
VSEFSDELQAEALKLILLNQFVEVDVKQLEDDAHVISKHKIVEPKEKQGDD